MLLGQSKALCQYKLKVVTSNIWTIRAEKFSQYMDSIPWVRCASGNVYYKTFEKDRTWILLAKRGVIGLEWDFQMKSIQSCKQLSIIIIIIHLQIVQSSSVGRLKPTPNSSVGTFTGQFVSRRSVCLRNKIRYSNQMGLGKIETSLE